MREFGQIQATFWTDPDLRQLSDQAKLLAAYLLTGSHTTSLGCMHLPLHYMAYDLNWEPETVSKPFGELFRNGFVMIDEPFQYVLIPNFLKFNRIKNPNVAKRIAKDFQLVPKKSSVFMPLVECLLRYGQYFDASFQNNLETVSKQFRNDIETVSKQREREREGEGEGEGEEKKYVELPLNEKNTPKIKPQIEDIFNYWCLVMNHHKANLDSKRHRVIKQRLDDGYSVEDLKAAIRGCKKTPHNMGQNDQGMIYDSLGLILRDSDHVDRFIHNDSYPPEAKNPAERRTQANLSIVRQFARIDDDGNE